MGLFFAIDRSLNRNDHDFSLGLLRCFEGHPRRFITDHKITPWSFYFIVFPLTAVLKETIIMTFVPNNGGHDTRGGIL